MQPLVQHTGETPQGPLELHAWLPSPTSPEPCRGALYQDDGETFAYRDGRYLRIAYACEVSVAEVSLRSRIEHAGFTPWWRSVRLTVHGVEAEPRTLHVNGQRVRDWRYDPAARSVVLVLPDALADWRLRLSLR
jgi:alpha-glucosidase